MFRDFDATSCRPLNDCAELISREDGLDETSKAIKAGLPRSCAKPPMRSPAICVADGAASQEELRILDLMRQGLDIERLIAAAIERGARARFQTP